MNSIDILDECLSISYKMRKSSIQSRKHKSKGDSGVKASFRLDDKVVPKGRYVHPKVYAEVLEILPNNRIRIRWPNDDQIEILDSHTLKAWNKGKKDFFEDEDEEAMPHISKLSAPEMKPIIQRQGSLKKMTVDVATAESQHDDMLAQKTFDAFKNELNEWWIENEMDRDDEDLRGQVADDFTERYMCHRMDPLPASREVTLIRKTMAGIIEDFACDGTLPSDITGEIIVTNKKKPITAYDIMKAKEEAEKQADSSYQKKREDERATETGVDRELKEKNKIKDQYENYMRLKSKTASHEDNQKEKEIEGHLDDIKALISTFQR